MRLVGIDLSANPRNCGVCVLEYDALARVSRGSMTDAHPEWLVDYCTGADVVAIDVPFGWPKPFAKALTGYEIGVALDRDRRQYLRRATDAWITERLPENLQREARPPTPFAVAADKLGVTAIVGTILLNALSDKFRLSPRQSSVPQTVVEAYPAVSLWAWGLRHRNFETSVMLEKLQRMFDLTIYEADREELLKSRHCFDALIAALTAKEYIDGNTFNPPERLSDDTLKVEGWIRVPNRSVNRASDT